MHIKRILFFLLIKNLNDIFDKILAYENDYSFSLYIYGMCDIRTTTRARTLQQYSPCSQRGPKYPSGHAQMTP